MYYLKYRPQTIGELDNLAPREIIRTILSTRKPPHAFLFIGQKGTGKTSMARIFAKAVNCRNNAFGNPKAASIEPCNTCGNCLSIDTSAFPDVTEMDAASNRGIAEVKELIKEASFLPMAGLYRVYIIDEAHMITPDGFNALLKTLEEPPETVIFILATTNLEKVPKTIVSRCVLVNFGTAQKPEIIHMLERIAKAEKLKTTPELLSFVAEHGDKSFRDAAKLLEELVMSGKMTVDEARTYIGMKSRDSLLSVLSAKSAQDAHAWIHAFETSGGSFRILIEETLRECHAELLAQNNVGGRKPVYALTVPKLVLLMKLLGEAYSEMKTTPIEPIPLEIAVSEFYNKSMPKSS